MRIVFFFCLYISTSSQIHCILLGKYFSFGKFAGNNDPWQFVCGVSDHTCNYNLVPGYDTYCMSFFVLFDGHTDNFLTTFDIKFSVGRK